MAVRLDYEGTLKALHALVGKQVMVSVVDAETGLQVALLYGPLRAADPAPDSEAVAPLGPSYGGEALVFGIGEIGAPYPEPVTSRFMISEAGFRGGKLFDEDANGSLTFKVGSVRYLITLRQD